MCSYEKSRTKLVHDIPSYSHSRNLHTCEAWCGEEKQRHHGSIKFGGGDGGGEETKREFAMFARKGAHDERIYLASERALAVCMSKFMVSMA
jgi:hypothetical protein